MFSDLLANAHPWHQQPPELSAPLSTWKKHTLSWAYASLSLSSSFSVQALPSPHFLPAQGGQVHPLSTQRHTPTPTKTRMKSSATAGRIEVRQPEAGTRGRSMEERVLFGLQALTHFLSLPGAAVRRWGGPQCSQSLPGPIKKAIPPTPCPGRPCWPPRLTWAGSPLTCSMKQVGVGARGWGAKSSVRLSVRQLGRPGSVLTSGEGRQLLGEPIIMISASPCPEGLLPKRGEEQGD